MTDLASLDIENKETNKQEKEERVKFSSFLSTLFLFLSTKMSTSLTFVLINLWLVNFCCCEKPDFVLVEVSGQPLPPPAFPSPTTPVANGQPPIVRHEGPLEPYDIIVHLHRSRRFLLTGAKNEGKLIVKLFPYDSETRNADSFNPEEQVFELDLTTTRLKTLTKQVHLSPEILIDEESNDKHSRSRSSQERLSHLKPQPVVSVMYSGDGEGSLEIRRVSFIPSGGSRRLDNIKKSKCAKFDDNNLLESRLGIQKVLTHKDCQSRLISRG